jgi:hypothetical protein
MTQRGRLGFLGVLLVGAGTLVASFLLRPFVPSAFATDTDSDGISDADEAAYGTLNNDSDTDNDGLSDFDEIFVYGTNPLDDDTDGDGTLDNVDGNPLQNGSTVDGTTTPTSTWSSNLTRPNFNGTSAEDGKAVLMHSGEFVHTVDLLSIRAGWGPDMQLTATYRSGISFDGIAGNNWTLSFMERVVESGNVGCNANVAESPLT